MASYIRFIEIVALSRMVAEILHVKHLAMPDYH